jgi:phage terminase large subunit
MDIKWNAKLFNDAYRKYLTCQTRTQIFFGGASSGKSYFILGQRVLFDILNGGRNFLICRNVAKTNRISTYNEIVKSINRTDALRGLFGINKSEMTITCTNGYQIFFAGLDDPEKLKSISPAKGVVTDVIFEEATEIDYDSYKLIRKRLRGKTDEGIKKREIFLFNPILKSHWIYREFFSGNWNEDEDTVYHDDELLILKTTYRDNRDHLEPEDINALESEKDPYYYDVYTDGNWGTLGDLVFKRGLHWRVDDLSEIKNNFNNYLNGLDFGFTNDPTALVRCTIKEDKIYVFNTHGGKRWDNKRIANEIEPIIGDDYIWCDSAEPKSIHELMGFGIRALAVEKSKDYLIHAIQWMHRHLIIIDKSCQELINELEIWQWQKDKFGESINKTVDKNNHWIDALHYALSSEIKKMSIKPAEIVTRKREIHSATLVGF